MLECIDCLCSLSAYRVSPSRICSGNPPSFLHGKRKRDWGLYTISLLFSDYPPRRGTCVRTRTRTCTYTRVANDRTSQPPTLRNYVIARLFLPLLPPRDTYCDTGLSNDARRALLCNADPSKFTAISKECRCGQVASNVFLELPRRRPWTLLA